MELDWNVSMYFNLTDQNATEIPTVLSVAKTANIPNWYESGRIQIPLYAVIFMLAVVGNTLVILTLVRILCVLYNIKLTLI